MITNFLLYILVGVIAGFLAGLIMRGGGFGLIVNLIVGIIGGFLGGWIMHLLNIQGSGLLWEIVTAVVGAVVFLFILSLFHRRK
ncbi:MAG: GlsB/YeaQ/YmgE family stress response membrane protein [Bacteroidales bacterium]|nr:GlsB/YeaQ/YmgE family stress response membrane protein [Bacteroidales bacterium]